MRGSQISGVNAGAFEAVTYQGMQTMGKALGLEPTQIRGMYEEFSAQFREMTSGLPNIDLPTRSLQASNATEISRPNTPSQNGNGIGRA